MILFIWASRTGKLGYGDREGNGGFLWVATRKWHRGTSWGIRNILCLTGMLGPWVHTFVSIHPTVYFKSMYLIVCKLYLNFFKKEGKQRKKLGHRMRRKFSVGSPKQIMPAPQFVQVFWLPWGQTHSAQLPWLSFRDPNGKVSSREYLEAAQMLLARRHSDNSRGCFPGCWPDLTGELNTPAHSSRTTLRFEIFSLH